MAKVWPRNISRADHRGSISRSVAVFRWSAAKFSLLPRLPTSSSCYFFFLSLFQRSLLSKNARKKKKEKPRGGKMIKGKNVASPLLSRLACGSIAAFTFARLFLSLLIVSCENIFAHTFIHTWLVRGGKMVLYSLKNKSLVISEWILRMIDNHKFIFVGRMIKKMIIKANVSEYLLIFLCV